MNMVSLFMPLLVMLGLMYSAMTIIKVIQLWNRFPVILLFCAETFLIPFIVLRITMFAWARCIS